MTLPASGAITLGDVATELGLAKPLTLGSAAVRALAGVASGPITLGQLRGKSAFTAELSSVRTFNFSGPPQHRITTYTETVTCNAPGATGYLWAVLADSTFGVSHGPSGHQYIVTWSVESDIEMPVENQPYGGLTLRCTASKPGATAHDDIDIYI